MNIKYFFIVWVDVCLNLSDGKQQLSRLARGNARLLRITYFRYLMATSDMMKHELNIVFFDVL